jgi:hypothetical protein
MMIRRCLFLAALAGATASTAWADGVGFEGSQYTVGSGLAGITDANGKIWEIEGTADLRDFVIDSAVFSPLANPLVGSTSTKSVRFDCTGSGSARLGLDLATPVTSGIVTLQFDVRNDVRLEGNNLIRVNVMNRSIPASTPVANADFLWGPYIQNGGSQAAAVNGNFGLGNGDVPEFRGIGVFADCRGQAPTFPDIYCKRAFAPEILPEATGANDRWYRVKMWFNLSDAVDPGRLMFAAIYDINCGSEIQIAENHMANQSTPIKKFNNASPNEVWAMELRASGGVTVVGDPIPLPVDHRLWLDNVVVGVDPTFVLPAPSGDAAPVAATTPNTDAGSQDVAAEFTLPANAGETPSLARVGSTFYTLDGNNGLTSWTAGPSSTLLDLALPVNFDANAAGVLVPNVAGTKLYVVANINGSLDFWPDLGVYDIAGAGWTVACDLGGSGGNVGNHSAALLTYNGLDHVMQAWRGSQEYTGLNSNNTRGPRIGNVGNRWAGACTEASAHGSAATQLYYLQQTDAVGTAISNHSQAFNAIYRAAFLGCDGSTSTVHRMSDTARLLPWVTNAADGSAVNAHAMEFEPARNRIWVLRAGGTGDIGIYDFAQDRYATLKLTKAGVPMVIDRADLLLSSDGSKMYILSRGEGAVYSVSTNVTIADRGACCVGSACSYIYQSACQTAGGVYRGNNVTCFAYTSGAGSAFEDISGTGTPIVLGDDNSAIIPIGFSFNFYGNAYTQAYVGANGYVAFSDDSAFWGSSSWVPTVNVASGPANLVAGWWTDLSPQVTPGTVVYQVLGSAPNRRLVVQWSHVSQFTGGAAIDDNNFEVVLFETTNKAEVRLGAINTAVPAPYASGIKNADGSLFINVPTASIISNATFAFNASPSPCSCRADFNQNGTLEVQDIFDFLNAWFAGLPSADFNGGGLAVQDIFDFLNAWFAGCN